MQTRFIALLFGWLVALSAAAQSVDYSTPRPRIDDINDPDVVINRIDLTAKYTIIYMRFRDGQDEQPAPSRRLRIPGIPYPIPDRVGGGGRTIHFVPTARLYANGGARSFKFIKADNIPTQKRRSVQPGEQVDFVAYFERLDPGIEVFDLFECSDRNRPGETCFNFWGVHVINPLKQRFPPPTTPPVKPRPTPPPAPKPTPEPEYKPTPPADVLAIKGTVRDAKTGKPVPATLTYRLLSGPESGGSEAADSIRAQAADGAYRIPGAALTVWDVTVTARGYFGQRDTIAISRAEKTVNFDLMPIVAGAKITLKNIYFAQSKYELQAESFPELDRLVTVMRQNPTMTIKLEGHTDIIGDFDANLELSRNRVFAVKRYLMSKGIAESRVEAVGYGHSRPINSTRGTPHPENRRVEMVITKV
ncbi:OmpA family protein [Fibrella sp. HMF5335]|uniref:OmpA family protein n=1 Tax=Fibrella rubiginis TaxID=2817060 RepID=A0A939GBJ1_9BACT|nr:OmpA family protein [Fibrella rubiginis]MBO0935341.1 OmpA family protein [Fibrella rubiginis]